MRVLVPCRSCHRHVLVSERACPFCSASFAALPLAMALALTPIGCGKQRQLERERAAASASARAEAERLKAEIERRQTEQQKKVDELRNQRAVYGAPPPRPAASGVGGTKNDCKCPPGDPLCTCF